MWLLFNKCTSDDGAMGSDSHFISDAIYELVDSSRKYDVILLSLSLRLLFTLVRLCFKVSR